MTRCLVTGSSGFLGRAVATRLVSLGHAVTGLDLVKGEPADFDTVIDDLTDAGRLEKVIAGNAITHIIHTGGISGPDVVPDRPDYLMQVNVGGSLQLLQAALRAAAKTFIYCSSITAGGPRDGAAPVTAERAIAPQATYPCSKAAFELVMRGLWKHVPLDMCALRIAGIYGPGRKTTSVVHRLADAALSGKTAPLTDNDENQYIYIDDAADAVIAACFSEKRSMLAYYCVYPEQIAPEDVSAGLAAIGAPAKTEWQCDPRRIAATPVDIATAERDFAFSPKVDFRAGLRRLIDHKRAG